MQPEDIISLKHAHRKICEITDNHDLFKSMSYTISFDEKSVGLGESKFSERPSGVSVKAAVADLRHFTMPKSRIIFGRLVRIVRAELEEGEIYELDHINDEWNKLIGNKPGAIDYMPLVLNGKTISRKDLIEIMINGDICISIMVKKENLRPLH